LLGTLYHIENATFIEEATGKRIELGPGGQRAGKSPAGEGYRIAYCRVLVLAPSSQSPKRVQQKWERERLKNIGELRRAIDGTTTMRTERRCVQRKRPGGISYFEFEAGSGGIVLDASEKGVGFQAADAVHQLGRNRIWISPSPEERIELTGEVVWTDISRKTGGLRFVETGAESSRRIRNWLGQQEESEEASLSEGVPLPAWATQALGDLRHEERHDASIPRSAAVPRARTEVEERPVELHPIPALPSLFASSMPWQPQISPTSESRIGYRIATGFLIGVLVVACVVLFDMFRPKVGESLIHLGEKINGSTNPQRQNSSPLPSSTPAPAGPSATNEAKPSAVQTEAKPDVVQRENPGDSALQIDSSKQTNGQTPDTTVPRTTPTNQGVPNRSSDREATSARQDRSVEATRLWSAVASGDSSAEVDLARLYLRGEGVPRNCEQAKVLLRAAAKGGSAEARQELKKLPSRGCR
jgi:PilZ domain